jgi:hypothetical protein
MYSLYRSSSLFLIAVVIAYSLVGCGQDKVAECNKLNLVINKGKAIPVPGNALEVGKMADSLDKIVGDLQAIALKDEKLKAFRDSFVKMYSNVSKKSRHLSTTAETKNRTEFDLAQVQVKAAVTPELSLVEEVNIYCAKN